MTIDQAYKLVCFVANKEQGGNISPLNFNLLAPQAQMEAVLVRLGNQKRLNSEFIAPIGYQSNQQSKEEILTLLVRPTNPLVITDGLAPYPDDYLAYDNLQRADGTLFTILESDQMGLMRKSRITPPIDTDPFVCFHQSGIEIRPETLTDVMFYYVRKPVDPNWDFSFINQEYIYNSTTTPQLTGKISHGFDTPDRLHKEICMIILKYVGINLDNDKLTAFAREIQETNP